MKKKKIEPIDAVKMMREIRKKFNEQIQGMTFEQEKAFIDSRIKNTLEKFKSAQTKKEDAA